MSKPRSWWQQYWLATPDSRGMAPRWNKESVRLRLEAARAMLLLHGALSVSENARVRSRLQKQFDKAKRSEPRQ